MEKLEMDRYFDAANPNWTNKAEYNRLFLKAQENYFNDLLKVRGHVFLNEVYGALGFNHTRDGATNGWALGIEGDNRIDFGISPEAANGTIRLSFNVNGDILNVL